MRRWNPFFRYPLPSLILSMVLCVPLWLALGNVGVRSEMTVLLEGDQRNLESYEKVQQILADVEVVVISMELPEVFSVKGIDAILRVSQALEWGIGVTDVKSLTHSVKPIRKGFSFEMIPLVPWDGLTEEKLAELKEWALGHPLVKNLMVSGDSRQTLIMVTYQRELETPEQQRALGQEIEKALAPFREEGYGFDILALPLVAEEVRGTLRSDLSVMVPVAMFLLITVLWVAFRSWKYVLLILINQLIVLAALPGAIHVAGYGLTVFSIMLLPLLTGIHLTLLAHVYSSIRRARGTGLKDGGEVVGTMLSEVFRSCAFATITTLAGLGSLTLSEVQLVSQFGIMGMIGVGLIFVMTFGPGVALLRLLAHRLPAKASPVDVVSGTGNEAFAERFHALITRQTRWICLLAVVGVGFGIFGISKIRTDIRATEFLSPDSPTRQAFEALDRDYGGVNVVQVEVDSGEKDGVNGTEYLRYLARVQDYVESRPEVTGVYSYAQLMAMMNQIWEGGKVEAMKLPDQGWLLKLFVIALKSQNFPFLTALADDEGRVGYLILRTQDMAAESYLELLEDVVTYAEETKPEGVTVSAAKGLHTILEADRRIVRSQVKTVGVTFLIVGIVLTLLWRSVWAAMISLVANAIPVAVVLAAAGIVGIPLNSITVMVGAIAFGIAVDDSVHFITRWRMDRKAGQSVREATLHALRIKAPPIVSSSAALIAVFSIFSLSSFPPVVAFGLLSGVAFAGALLCTLILLPLMLKAVTRS